MWHVLSHGDCGSSQKLVTSSKNNQRSEYDRASLGRGKNRGGSAYPYNPDKFNAGKRKRKHTGHPINDTTVTKNT